MNKTFATIVTLLLSTGNLAAQTDKLETWIRQPQGSLCKQKFARKALDKTDCQRAHEIIDSLWIEATKERLGDEWKRLTLTNDTLKLACACRDSYSYAPDGRSLFISLHGGGSAPKEVNDQQWNNQIYLYTPKEGLYIAPRAPWNTWDMWHKEGIDTMFEKLIQACCVFEGVNPNKVYIMGYSAGGDGVWRLAPRMADKWAAASMMAGHPGETSQINLRNLPYMIWMGELDNAYDRNRLAVEKATVMDSLQQHDPEGYIHSTHIIENKGHWMEQADTASLDWMSRYRRNPYPKKIVWRQEQVVRPHFYWLSAPTDELAHGKTVIVERNGNTIDIKKCDYSRLTIYLNDNMADLDKKITILYNGKKVKSKKLKRTIANLHNSINLRNDRSYAFPCIIEVEL